MDCRPEPPCVVTDIPKRDMGGQCLWKFNSMGGGVKIKVPSSPSSLPVFFSGIALISLPTDSLFKLAILTYFLIFVLIQRH